MRKSLLTGRGKSPFGAGFSSTGILACERFAAFTFGTQPRMAVLLDFFRSHLRHVVAGLLLAGIAGAIPAAANRAKGAPAILTIHVHNYANVDSKTLKEAEKAATNVFRHAGAETRWVNHAIAGAPKIEEDADTPSIGLSDLWVGIYSRPMADAFGLPGNVMGVAPGRGPDRQLVYVFYDSVEALATRQVLAMTHGYISRPATPAQILGHMIAHEAGHVLLNLPSHSHCGIMRGDWDLADLQDAAFSTLFFTAAQEAVIRTEVARREQHEALNVAEQDEPAR